MDLTRGPALKRPALTYIKDVPELDPLDPSRCPLQEGAGGFATRQAALTDCGCSQAGAAIIAPNLSIQIYWNAKLAAMHESRET